MIRFVCDGCHQKIKAPIETAGRSAECPQCSKRVRIPAILDAGSAADSAGTPLCVTEPPLTRSRGPTAGANASEWAEVRLQIVDFEMMKSEWQSIDWSRLNPLAHVVKDHPWSLVWVQLLTFAFCFPLGMTYSYDADTSISEAAWALSLYFAILWAIFLHRCILPERLPRRTIVGLWCATAILGFLAVILISAIGSSLPGLRQIFAASRSDHLLGRWIGFTLSVGFVEELVKGIPVYWIATRLPPGSRLVTSMYLGAVSGLAFGATEGLGYSVGYAVEHQSDRMTSGTYLVVQVLRFVSLPLLHAIWSATLGYFIGCGVSSSIGARGTLAVGLVLVSGLHGTYNTVCNHWGGLAMAVLSLTLFVGYVRRGQQDLTAADSVLSPREHLDRAAGQGLT